jgi:class 3 adenylate cyclase
MADLTTQRVTHEPDAVTATFMFADIAGFTALTEAHGDKQAATLVADFCDAVKAKLPVFGGTQVKTIGDALMLRIDDARQAVVLDSRSPTTFSPATAPQPYG